MAKALTRLSLSSSEWLPGSNISSAESIFLSMIFSFSKLSAKFQFVLRSLTFCLVFWKNVLWWHTTMYHLVIRKNERKSEGRKEGGETQWSLKQFFGLLLCHPAKADLALCGKSSGCLPIKTGSYCSAPPRTIIFFLKISP